MGKNVLLGATENEMPRVLTDPPTSKPLMPVSSQAMLHRRLRRRVLNLGVFDKELMI